MDMSLFSNSELVAAAHVIADGLMNIAIGIAAAGAFNGLLRK